MQRSFFLQILVIALSLTCSTLGRASIYPLASPGTDYVKAADTDLQGRVLISTLYSGTIQVDPVTQLPGGNGIDVGVIRYLPDTGRSDLAFSLGGPGTQVPHGIEVDNAGNIVVSP